MLAALVAGALANASASVDVGATADVDIDALVRSMRIERLAHPHVSLYAERCGTTLRAHASSEQTARIDLDEARDAVLVAGARSTARLAFALCAHAPCSCAIVTALASLVAASMFVLEPLIASLVALALLYALYAAECGGERRWLYWTLLESALGRAWVASMTTLHSIHCGDAAA